MWNVIFLKYNTSMSYVSHLEQEHLCTPSHSAKSVRKVHQYNTKIQEKKVNKNQQTSYQYETLMISLSETFK